MSVARSVAEVLRDHVELEVEAIDRMYLNVYVPHLQTVGATVGYLRKHRGQRFASTTAVAPMTEAFIRNIEEFVDRQGIDLVSFVKRQRKDDVTQQYLRRFEATEGVLYVGKAQEKARVMRTERRRSSTTGATYPWIVESTAMVNHYYFYCVDQDFGPFFLKFCSYFPYNAKLCINGNEYLKRQLAKRGVAFEALDNGIKSCADPRLAQRLCDGLSAEKIDRLLRKWLRRLPHPFPPRRRLSLPALDPAGRVLAHPGARPAGDRTRLLRAGHPRESRYRTPDPGQPGVRPQGHPPHPRPVPHPRHHRRRGAFAARRLQEEPYQAVPQGGAGPPHRNHDQRHPRLRHRPTHRESRGTAQGRLCRQPTSARRPTHRPRLLHRRSILPGHAKTRHHRQPARRGTSLRRPARSGALPRHAAVPPRPRHIHPQGCSRAPRSTARAQAEPIYRRPHHL